MTDHERRRAISSWGVAEFRERWGTGMNPHLDWILSTPDPAITCDSRAVGCWDANLLDEMAMYERLAELIRAGAFA